ncbi:MAG: choice-of-anchor tandem repeat GloVer-containing protein [Verrucomicrobiota bacterium]
MLKTFEVTTSGAYPRGRLMKGADGLLYGTTDGGGSNNAGTVFKLNPDGSDFAVLKNFDHATTGSSLYAGLIQGTDGSLYGTAALGGSNDAGTVFKLNPDGTGFTVLQNFDTATTGGNPYGGVMQGADGCLYGTATFGGSGGSGTVFKLNPDGTGFTAFPLSYWTTGGHPYGGLIQATDGTLYGTASWGGSSGDGTVFKINPNGTNALPVKNFDAATSSGTFPYAGLLMGTDGMLYGTAFYSGSGGFGTVFRLATDGTAFSVLHSFEGTNTGAYPSGWLIQGADGALYGTAAWGGINHTGTVFKVATNGTGFTVLRSFGLDFVGSGGYLYAGLLEGEDGTLYGAANSGGTFDRGTLFSLGFDTSPVGHAGLDFSVNEGQLTLLDGSQSSDADNDVLAYAWTQLPGGAPVTLTNANTTQPTFTAPAVAIGGETLSFQLTVTAEGKSSTDTVSVTVVNVNHPPVADAGVDQSIAEGSPVSLDGGGSFDIDNDSFSYAWVQVENGSPSVSLTGADTSNPTFTAPFVGTNGQPGVVATLVFELRVDDGYPQEAPAPGYALENVRDRVTIAVTNLNNEPTADAGADQTVDENTLVALNGTASSDPDCDSLTYAWSQISGPAVILSDTSSATPGFSAPFVNAGGANLVFQLTTDDGHGGTDTDSVVVHVQNRNDPPLASAALPTISVLWPPNHSMVAVGITGVSDPDNNAVITITAVTQDEPANGLGDGDTPVDAVILADGTVLLRAERSGTGDGRVYRVYFTASDAEGSASGMVNATVPHTFRKPAIDSGGVYSSTE